MSWVRRKLSDNDDKAILVQRQLKLDLPTGIELGNNRCPKWFPHTLIHVHVPQP